MMVATAFVAVVAASTASAAGLKPHLGDWEAVARGGYRASFDLGRVRPYPGRIPFGFKDLVLIESATCPRSLSTADVNVSSGRKFHPFGANGSFGLSAIGLAGRVTGARSAVLSAKYDTGTAPGCRGKLVWRFHPARRAPVADGKWRLQIGTSSPETFVVQAGGRVAENITLQTCSGYASIYFFIPPNAKASIVSPVGDQLSLAFTRRNATGQLSTPASSTCTASTVAVHASLIHRGQ
jgi:hypothetical protein